MKVLQYLILGSFLLMFNTLSSKAADDAHTKALLSSYEKVRMALVKDDLGAVKTAAKDLAASASEAKQEVIAKSAQDLAASDSLDKARDHFKMISKAAIPLVEKKEGYYVLTCPMAKADWIQTSKDVENPYMGKEMLKCGSVKMGPQSSLNSQSQAMMNCSGPSCCK